jgi:hypothetical protein
MPARPLPAGAIEALRQRLSALPSRRAERRQMIRETAATYGVSETTVYRALQRRTMLQAVHRGDRGTPRVLPQDQLERYCELIAAMKLRTANKQGRHLSTAETIRLLEDYGVETPDGFVRAPKGLLKRSTVNRYLKHWGYDPHTLARQPPAVRFQAQHSNDCWHFDLSPSDLKQVPAPAWVREDRGHPLLMLYSVVDDRSGVAYQEYHGVYGKMWKRRSAFSSRPWPRRRLRTCPFRASRPCYTWTTARLRAVRCSTRSCATWASRSARICPRATTAGG